MKKRTRIVVSHLLSMVAILTLLFYFSYEKKTAKQQTKIVSDIEENLTEKEKKDGHYSINDQVLNTLGILYVPKINLSLPVYEGTSEQAISSGVGQWEYSPGKLGGGVGNRPLLTSHNGLSVGNLFTQLPRLDEGDLFYVRLKGQDEILAYKVVKKEVMTPDEASEIKAEEDKDLVTLMTCYPIFLNTDRMMITGERTEYNQEKISKNKNFLQEYWLIIILIILVLREIYKTIKDLKGVDNEKVD